MAKQVWGAYVYNGVCTILVNIHRRPTKTVINTRQSSDVPHYVALAHMRRVCAVDA